MKPQIPQPQPLGDITDIEAYVRKIVSDLAAPIEPEHEFEEMVAEGLALAYERNQELRPGQSLRQNLAGWLNHRLLDAWRRNHREYRRNTRAGTATYLGTPTSLPNDETTELRHLAHTSDPLDLVSSLLRTASITNATQLRDPRVIGRFVGVPSWGAFATGVSNDVYEYIVTERETTTVTLTVPEFRALLDPKKII